MASADAVMPAPPGHRMNGLRWSEALFSKSMAPPGCRPEPTQNGAWTRCGRRPPHAIEHHKGGLLDTAYAPVSRSHVFGLHKLLPKTVWKGFLRKITKDEEEIRRWAARYEAHPIERAPFRPDGEPAQLGFVFGETPVSNENLQPIAWSRFFAVFHLLGLVFAHSGDAEYELLKPEEKNTQGRFEGKLMA